MTPCGGWTVQVSNGRRGWLGGYGDLLFLDRPGGPVPPPRPLHEAAAGHAISFNGLGASTTTGLFDGDVVTLVPKVEG